MGIERAMTHDTDIAVVGSGFSGLGMAIRLKQAGIHDFVVLERADDVGGTWQANTYPGCACDVPSHLYSFSFAPNSEWTQTYSPQPEIWDYLRGCADAFGVRAHIRLGCAVESAGWQDRDRRWEIETSHGTYRARVLIGAMEARLRPRRQARRLDRHRGVGDPVRAGDPAARAAAARLPAHRAVGRAALQPPDHRRGAAPLPRAPRASAA